LSLSEEWPTEALAAGPPAALYRKRSRDPEDLDHPAVRAALAQRGSGALLSEGVRRSLETRFRARFDRVRIHTDSVAADACRALGASAFTIGEDIFFAEGRYSDSASELLAHELTHVVQAQQGRTAKAGLSHSDDPLEREAESTAARVSEGGEAEPTAAGVSGDGDAAPGGRETGISDGTLLRDGEREELIIFSEAWFTAKPFTISKGGQVSASDQGDKVRIQSPAISASCDVELKLPDDKKMGSHSVKVGPIQTLLSSKRTGVYQKDGKNVEQSSGMGQVRDAAEGTYSPGGPVFAPVEAPFYSGNPAEGGAPAGSGLDTWSGDGVSFSATVRMNDSPGFSLPKKLPGGEQLVAVKGADNFNTSAGFKTDTGEIFGLSPFGWTLDWSTPIAGDGTANPDPARDAITSYPVTEAVIENTTEYANLIARFTFDSVDQAMKEPAWTLLQMLPIMQARDAAAAGIIADALSQKNPSFSVTVIPLQGVGQEELDGPSDVGDSVTMQVSGTITKTSPTRSVTALQGTGGSVVIALNEMADAASLTGSSVLVVFVAEEDHLGGGVSIPFPFTGGGSIGQGEGSEGDYKVKVSHA